MERTAGGGGTAAVARVLVADDDPDINRLIRLRLAARGYQVAAAANGAEALAAVASSAPDLLFLDVAMPGIGGLEVLERVRAEDRDVAVIMMTAFGSEGVAVDALRRGADDYLRKPFQRDEFEAVLERTVARLALRRQNAALRRQLDARRRELEAELARAGRTQADLLPAQAPALPAFDLAARCIPAQDVGGDFYDWYAPQPSTLVLTVADVMGKGMAAALLMATARAALRAVGQANRPAAAVQAAAAALQGDLERSSSFITLFHGRLDAAAGALEYVDAGHGYTLLRRADGAVEDLPPRGLPLGVLAGEPYAAGVVHLRPGDVVALYSDGLVEAAPGGALDRHTLAAALVGGSAADMADRLVALAALEGPPPDDLTVVVLRRVG
jgi:serine phosphatase RsbU (regulator of sigma subunit)